MVRRGDSRGNKQPQDLTMYGQICGSICLMQQNGKRSKSVLSRIQSSIRGIFFIQPDDEELKPTMINARRKLENPDASSNAL